MIPTSSLTISQSYTSSEKHLCLQGQGENAALNPKGLDVDLCHLGAPGRSPLPAGPGVPRCSAWVRSDAARGS